MKALLAKAWALLKRGAYYVFHHPFAAAATVFVVLFAVFGLAFGKKIQIGGLLGLLWGKKEPDVRGVPPEGRKDDSGNVIPPGVSDDQGFVQAPVTTKIVEPGIFSDPTEIVVQHPDKGQVVVKLPEGVKNKDVQEVVEVKPDVFEVRNKDTGADPKKLDDLSKKLGG